MKMHGLGNDFVVLDARAGAVDLSVAMVRAIGDRHRGIGFDQLAVIMENEADGHLVFYNSDGSESAACGNATRCIARYLMDQTGKAELTLSTGRGRLQARDAGGGLTSVNMGPPQLDWRDIPLAREVDTRALPIQGAPVATGMGNPHCTFFVEDAEAIDLAARGPEVETNALFPERTNVQFASLLGPNRLRLRVWERGAGITLASGSSSCAVAVAAVRCGLADHEVRIELDGGTLDVAWREDGVWMTGPTTHVADGRLTAEFLETVT